MPCQPAWLEFKPQFVGQRFKVMRVVAGVLFHPPGERAPGPIGFLQAFFKFHARDIFPPDGCNRTGGGRPAARQAWCRKPRRARTHGASEQAQVIIGAVHDQLMGVQRVQQRVQIDPASGSINSIAGGGADLNQTDLFRVGVKAVRLGVHRDPCGRSQFWKKFPEQLFRVNHAGSIGVAQGRRQSVINRALPPFFSLSQLRRGEGVGAGGKMRPYQPGANKCC